MQRHGVTQKKGSVALWKAFSFSASITIDVGSVLKQDYSVEFEIHHVS